MRQLPDVNNSNHEIRRVKNRNSYFWNSFTREISICDSLIRRFYYANEDMNVGWRDESTWIRWQTTENLNCWMMETDNSTGERQLWWMIKFSELLRTGNRRNNVANHAYSVNIVSHFTFEHIGILCYFPEQLYHTNIGLLKCQLIVIITVSNCLEKCNWIISIVGNDRLILDLVKRKFKDCARMCSIFR